MVTLEQVFGVGNKQVLSYYERVKVDGIFKEALRTDKQIIVYGSSKQGKTALVGKHVPYDENIVISLDPKMALIDIHRSILSKLGARIQVSSESSTNSSLGSKAEVTAKVSIPFVGGGSGKIGGDAKSETKNSKKFQHVEVNLELADSIAEIVSPLLKGRFIILENFHYLNDEIQRELAFALRSYQELGVRFIILGVWRQKNRLTQFNGDLVDRIREIPVEPWTEEEFRQVIGLGCHALNIQFSEEIIKKIISNAFDSIGVVQELLKLTCQFSGIESRSRGLHTISDISYLDEAISKKADDYALRHVRALEDIAEGRRLRRNLEEGLTPLYLPYYIVRAFLTVDFVEIQTGVKRTVLESEIRRIHHDAERVRNGDMSNILKGFAELQVEKGITPPIFDYDQATKTMRVVDSTFYFFLKNTDRAEIIDGISSPVDRINS